jgi:hypothetical protein
MLDSSNPHKGTDNMGFVFFAMHHMHMEMVVFWDILHMTVNEVNMALQRSRLWPTVLSLLLVFRLPYGPWAGQKFWHELQDSAKHLAVSTAEDSASVFGMWLGDSLAQENSGSRCVQEDVWDLRGVRPRQITTTHQGPCT